MTEICFRRTSKRDVFANPIGLRCHCDAGELLKPFLVERARRAEAQAQTMHKEMKVFRQRHESFLAAVKEVFRGDFEAVHPAGTRVNPRCQFPAITDTDHQEPPHPPHPPPPQPPPPQLLLPQPPPLVQPLQPPPPD